jgi:hypothetical protein
MLTDVSEVRTASIIRAMSDSCRSIGNAIKIHAFLPRLMVEVDVQLLPSAALSLANEPTSNEATAGPKPI